MTLAGSVKGSSAAIHSPAMQMRNTMQNSTIRSITNHLGIRQSSVYTAAGRGSQCEKQRKKRRFFADF